MAGQAVRASGRRATWTIYWPDATGTHPTDRNNPQPHRPDDLFEEELGLRVDRAVAVDGLDEVEAFVDGEVVGLEVPGRSRIWAGQEALHRVVEPVGREGVAFGERSGCGADDAGRQEDGIKVAGGARRVIDEGERGPADKEQVGLGAAPAKFVVELLEQADDRLTVEARAGHVTPVGARRRRGRRESGWGGRGRTGRGGS